MRILKNILALIGLCAVLVAGYGYMNLGQLAEGFDPRAGEVYAGMFDRLLETHDIAEATIWRIPVEEGISTDDVDETLKFVANEHNLSLVGELPLSEDIKAKRGENYRFVKIYLLCNSLTAAQMLDYSDAYAAYLPCRISLVEDKQGKLWLMALDMDMMIYGGAALPEKLKQKALQVKEQMLDIMHRAATGEF